MRAGKCFTKHSPSMCLALCHTFSLCFLKVLEVGRTVLEREGRRELIKQDPNNFGGKWDFRSRVFL